MALLPLKTTLRELQTLADPACHQFEGLRHTGRVRSTRLRHIRPTAPFSANLFRSGLDQITGATPIDQVLSDPGDQVYFLTVDIGSLFLRR